MIDINKARIILSQKLIHRLRAMECKSPRKDIIVQKRDI